MKTFLAATLLIYTVSAQAQGRSLIFTAYMSGSGMAPILRSGLAESSFDYSSGSGLRPENKTVCYTEQSDRICAEILKTAQNSQQRYLNGESHDAMYLRSCSREHRSIRAFYILANDFGESINIHRTLLPCENQI